MTPTSRLESSSCRLRFLKAVTRFWQSGALEIHTSNTRSLHTGRLSSCLPSKITFPRPRQLQGRPSLQLIMRYTTEAPKVIEQDSQSSTILSTKAADHESSLAEKGKQIAANTSDPALTKSHPVVDSVDAAKDVDEESLDESSSASTALEEIAPEYPVDRVQEAKGLSWTDVGIPDKLKTRLLELNLKEPSAIQELAFKPLLEGKDVLLQAETGTGKTLAYLLPTILRLAQKEARPANSKHALSPRILILTQSKELCHQIVSQIKALNLSLKTIILPPPTGIPLQPFANPDIAVTTIDAIYAMYKTPANMPKLVFRTQSVVIDEADSVLRAPKHIKFLITMLRIIETLSGTRRQRRKKMAKKYEKKFGPPVVFRHAQFVFSAATLPPVSLESIQKSQSPKAFILRLFRNLEIVKTAGTHKPPSSLVQSFLRVAPKHKRVLIGDEEATYKLEALRNTVKMMAEETEKRGEPKIQQWIVFCNRRLHIEKVYEDLTKFVQDLNPNVDIEVQTFHARVADDPQERLQVLQNFVTAKTKSTKPSVIQILVTNDIISRGLDNRNVNLVISFDFPKNITDYLNRLGRTARFGAHGDALNFVTPQDEMFAQKLEHIATLPALEATAAYETLFKTNRSIAKKIIALNAERRDIAL
ncbi:hypothetical protein HDV05_002028 [Chytridiales sp. JEL 0842]|nr:hypothetical protein HDV05_002028 [Chytridiales sp. JEL 0842]